MLLGLEGTLRAGTWAVVWGIFLFSLFGRSYDEGTLFHQGSQVPTVVVGWMWWGGGLRMEGWAWLYLVPLLLHPVCRAVLVSTRMDGQGLGSWVTLRVRDHLPLQVATGDETAYASLTTWT